MKIHHVLSDVGGYCLECGENEEYIRRARPQDTLEYASFTLVAPE